MRLPKKTIQMCDIYKITSSVSMTRGTCWSNEHGNNHVCGIYFLWQLHLSVRTPIDNSQGTNATKGRWMIITVACCCIMKSIRNRLNTTSVTKKNGKRCRCLQHCVTKSQLFQQICMLPAAANQYKSKNSTFEQQMKPTEAGLPCALTFLDITTLPHNSR